MATIQGFVKEYEGSPIPNVTIALIDPEGFYTTTITNTSGKYIFKNINKEGTYKICEIVKDLDDEKINNKLSQPEGYAVSTSRRMYMAQIKEEDIIVDVEMFTHCKTNTETITFLKDNTNTSEKYTTKCLTTSKINNLIYSVDEMEDSDTNSCVIRQSISNKAEKIIYRYDDIVHVKEKLRDTISVTIDDDGYLYFLNYKREGDNNNASLNLFVIDASDSNNFSYMMPVNPHNKTEIYYTDESVKILDIHNSIEEIKDFIWKYDDIEKCLKLIFDKKTYKVDRNSGLCVLDIQRLEMSKKEEPIQVKEEITIKSENITVDNPVIINPVVMKSNLSKSNLSATPYMVGVGDEITYTINIINSGNADATNVLLSSIISKGATYKQGTLTLDGAIFESSPDNLFLGNIHPGKTYVIQFKALVNYVPADGNIIGTSNINYSDVSGEQQNFDTNNTLTKVFSPDFVGENINNFQITSNPVYAIVDDEINYKILLKNVGNVSAVNSVLKLLIPENISIINGSLMINGESMLGLQSENEIYIGLISPNESKEILVKGRINSFTEEVKISAMAELEYNYESTSMKYGGINSNKSFTIIRGGYIKSNTETLSVDKINVSLNDVVLLKVKVQNEGNEMIYDCIVQNDLPRGLKYVDNSISINGVYDRSQNLENGVSIGKLEPQEIKYVEFRMKVNEEDIGIINNKSKIIYFTDINPNKPIEKKSIDTNLITIYNSNPKILINQTSNKKSVISGDVITYDVKIENKGNVDVNKLILKNKLNPSLKYVENMTINNIQVKNELSSSDGIKIEKVFKDEEINIRYQAKVVGANPKIPNTITSSYEYENPDKTTKINTTSSNECVVNGVDTQVLISNTSSNYKVNVGSTFDINIKIKNIGEADAINTIIKDMLPDALQVEKIVIDGVEARGDIRRGIEGGPLVIDDIKNIVIRVKAISSLAYEYVNNATICLKYKLSSEENLSIKYEDAIDPNPIIISPAKLEVNTSLEKYSVLEGEVIPYTMTIKNTGNVDLENVRITNDLPAGLEFIKGSLKVNETNYEELDINEGVNIPNIKVRGIYIISFNVKVVGIGKITTKSSVDFEYKDKDYKNMKSGNDESNEVVIQSFNGDIKLIKSSSKREVEIEDIINYKVEIRNDSDIDAYEVVFKDNIPDYLEFVADSFMVNNKSVYKVNPLNGVLIPNISKESNVIINYKCRVKGANSNNDIVNSAYIICKYKLDDGTNGSIETNPLNGGISVVKFISVNNKVNEYENTFKNVNKNQNTNQSTNQNTNIDNIQNHSNNLTPPAAPQLQQQSQPKQQLQTTPKPYVNGDSNKSTIFHRVLFISILF